MRQFLKDIEIEIPFVSAILLLGIYPKEYKLFYYKVSTKNKKISWARWRVPVIPATQEAEAAELPEPRRRRLQ